ncbi:MAG: sugar ABC transporter permease [Proteobacteria bacterium]|nr:sugar ABC transporter permease [Pseudomonadota bacterium]
MSEAVLAEPVAGRSRRRRFGAELTPYLFLAPALIATAVIVFLPVIQTIAMSLYDYVLYRPRSIPFVGLGNYARLWADEVFWISLWNSVLWVLLTVALQFLLGFAAALLLNESFIWRPLARAAVIIPWALPSVIIALMWTWMYDFNLGVFNDALTRLGLIQRPQAWLATPDTALYAVILALTWQGFPFFAVVILAGLQAIPGELYEAAEIDGAGRWQSFRYVTIPGLAAVIATALLLRIIWVANSLDVILVMTGGGPGYATHTLPLYAFLRAYSGMEFGYGAALAVVLTVTLLALVALYVARAQRGSER